MNTSGVKLLQQNELGVGGALPNTRASSLVSLPTPGRLALANAVAVEGVVPCSDRYLLRSSAVAYFIAQGAVEGNHFPQAALQMTSSP